MDNELIERARELAQAATLGPWYFDDEGAYGYRVRSPSGHMLFETFGGLDTPHRTWNNAEFCAASRELVPQLADALEAAQAENARLREALDAANADAERLFEWANDYDNHNWRCKYNRLDKGLPCNCGLENDLQAHRDRIGFPPGSAKKPEPR